MATCKHSPKCDFCQVYIYKCTSPNEKFDNCYPLSNAFPQFSLKLELCKLYKATRYLTKCDVIDEIKLFLTAYIKLILSNFFMLFN